MDFDLSERGCRISKWHKPRSKSERHWQTYGVNITRTVRKIEAVSMRSIIYVFSAALGTPLSPRNQSTPACQESLEDCDHDE